MSNEIKDIEIRPETAAIVPFEFNAQQVELIKKTVAKNCSNDELALFLYTCKRTGLDPLIKQIYAVKRGGASNQMSIQTGIDGYRLIAERSGKYAPGKEPSFKEDGGKIISATAYVNKLVAGSWHEVAATAYYNEYFTPTNNIWVKMPHAMLAKCAEALALRKAFPAEMAGVYTQEEMAQAEVVTVPVIQKTAPLPEPTKEELEAKAAEAKAKLHAQKDMPKEDPKSEPGATEGPSKTKDDFIVKGKITKHYPPTGKGPHSFKVEGFDQYLKTFDEMMSDNLIDHMNDGDVVEITYGVTVRGDYSNNMIVGVAVQR